MYRGLSRRPCIEIIYTHPSRVGGIHPLFSPSMCFGTLMARHSPQRHKIGSPDGFMMQWGDKMQRVALGLHWHYGSRAPGASAGTKRQGEKRTI